MKCLLLVATLTAVLSATPSIAQQGPAGVPGAFGFAESIVPPPPPAPALVAAKNKVDKCAGAKDVKQCKARLEARAKALEACKGKSGTLRSQCLAQQARIDECRKASEPARCLQYEKTREVCHNKLGGEHQQCLRDMLTRK